MNSGIWLALAAYVIWGLFPLFFKALESVPSLQILAHRMVWSLLVVVLLLLVLRRWAWLAQVKRQPSILARFAASALLLSTNWGLYIWAVNAGHVVDASLGYYINPLVNVALGALLLHERLRRLQWVAVAFAAVGVSVMALEVGHLPWISLGLAFSFAGYGLLRKTAPLGSLEGLALETALLCPLALLYLGWLDHQGVNAFADAGWTVRALLIAAGPITTVPLLMFAAGARRISFSLLGLLQFVTPTLQFLLGVGLYHEAFGAAKAVGFGLVWAGLAVFVIDSLHSSRRAAGPASTASTAPAADTVAAPQNPARVQG